MGVHTKKPSKAKRSRSRMQNLAKARAMYMQRKKLERGEVNAAVGFPPFNQDDQELLYPDVQLDLLDEGTEDSCERQQRQGINIKFETDPVNESLGNRFFYQVLQNEEPCSKTCILCCRIVPPPPSNSNDDLLDFSAADVNLDFQRFCQLMKSKLAEFFEDGSKKTKKFNPNSLVEALTLNSEEDAVTTPKKPKLSVCEDCQSKVSLSMNLQKEIEEKNQRVSDLKQKLVNELRELQEKVEGFCGELENIQEIVEGSHKLCENYLEKNQVENVNASINDQDNDDDEPGDLSILKEIVYFREGINNVVRDFEFRKKCGYGEPFCFRWAPPLPAKATILNKSKLKPVSSNRRKRRLIVKTEQNEFESNQESDANTVVKEEPQDDFFDQDENNDDDDDRSMNTGPDDDLVDMDFKTEHEDEAEVADEDFDLPMDIDPNFSGEDETSEVEVYDPLSDTAPSGEIENAEKQKKPVAKNVSPCVKKPKMLISEISNVTQNRDIYRCSLCPMLRVPMNLTNFVKHLNFHNDNPSKCTVCGSYMPGTDEAMISHWKKFHGKTMVSEPEKTQFTLVVANKAKLFPCNMTTCVQWFSSVDERNDHEVKFHHLVIFKPFSCDICKEGHYSTTEELMLHEAVAHPEKVKLASYSSTSDIPDGTQKLCQLCGEVCGKTSDSLIHKICKHSDIFNVLFYCTICGSKHFSTPNDHQNHVRTDHLPKLITNQQRINEYKGKLPVKINKTSPVVLARCYLCPKFQGTKSDFKLQLHLHKKHYMKVALQTDTAPEPKPKVLPTPSHEQEPQTALTALQNCKRTFKCPTCPHLGEMALDVFVLHITFHYRRPNKCTECSSYLSNNPVEIDNHWNDRHKNLVSSSSKCAPAPKPDLSAEMIWQCCIGNCATSKEFFSTEEELDQHEESAHEGIVKSLECNGNGCSKRFSDAVNLRLHKAICHPEIINVSCYYCDETFAETSIAGIEFCNPSKLFIHMYESHRKGSKSRIIINECYYCGMTFREVSKFVEHMTTNHKCGKKCLQCEICFRNFSYEYAGRPGRQGLVNHVMRYHRQKQMTCDICGLQLREALSLANHKFQLHGVAEAGRKVWSCETCGYKTTKEKHLAMHKETHLAPEDRPRPFACDQCGKTFTRNVKLTRHLAIHENANSKPYKCEICGASFAVKNYLYIHNRLSHAGRYFPSTHKKKTKTTKNDQGESSSTKSAESESSQSQSHSSSNSNDNLNGNSQQVQ